MTIPGRIIEEQKNYYIIDTAGGPVRASTKGLLKKDKVRVCVGDMVDCEVINEDSRDGIIFGIHERKSFFKRPSLANLTQMILVATFREPPIDLESLDRLLLCAGAYELSTVIVFNKSDLTCADSTSKRRIIDALLAIGYPVLETSARTGDNLEALLAACAGHVSAFAGLSGVGKSALLSLIFPNRKFVLGKVSGSNGRGTHTTTHVALLPLPAGGYIADTPGVSLVDLPLVPEEDVVTYFPELERLIGGCKFNNCIHDNEPGCKVRELVEAGKIAVWRYEHYRKIYREMLDRRREYK
ncbi:MAG: ribosome small subunit-dependent GTPase A [Chitinispirillaceae bacterium]|jgi:ribosome biogenesis GTPase